MSRPYSSIYEAATQCCQNLQQSTNSLEFPALAHDEWARKRLADFNLWASGSRALAKQRALDLRLASQPQIKEVVINLLSLLDIYLENCKKTARGFKSDYFSLCQDVEAEDTISSSKSNVELAKISNLLKGVEVMINQLVRVSIAVHRSGTRARLERADHTFNATRHCELFDHLYILIYASTLTEEDKFAGNTSVLISHDNLNEIQMRLINANLRRRHRFLYARRRSRHQRIDRTRESGVQKQNPQKETEVQDGPTNKADLAGPHPKSSGEERSERHTTISKSERSVVPATETASSLTNFDGLIEVPLGEQLSMVAPSSTSAKIVYPRARTIPGQDLFTCPCCYQSLPVHISRGPHWRKHLSEDISPYTCILPNCSRPYDLYTSRADWMNHMQNDHLSSQYWLCLACAEPCKFDEKETFVQHLMSGHDDSISPDQIPFFVSECACTAPVEIESCPLCPPSLSEAIPLEPGVLLDEIARHIHSFSVNSLPWPVPGEQEFEYLGREKNDEFSYFEISSDHGSLDKIEPPESEESDLHSDKWELLGMEFEDSGPNQKLATSIPESMEDFEGGWDSVYDTDTIRGQPDLEDDITMQEFIANYKLQTLDEDKDEDLLSEEKNESETEDEAVLLLQAAQEGDEDGLKALLLQEPIPQIDFIYEVSGHTPLSCAAREGHATIVKLLLDHGADPDFKSSHGSTPLLWAAENGHGVVTKLLLSKGASIEEKEEGSHHTALSLSARKGHHETVKLLIEYGAYLESRDDAYGQTPLLWAVESGHDKVVLLLLDAGADIEAREGINGQTPLSLAARKGHWKIVRSLIATGADIESRDSHYGETPLLWASENGHATVVEILLENGANVKAEDENGRTPLSWAQQKGHEQVVKLLKGYLDVS